MSQARNLSWHTPVRILVKAKKPRRGGFMAPCAYDNFFALTAAKLAFHVSQT
jgi:hypothetical protein